MKTDKNNTIDKNNNYDKNVIILILSHSYDLVSHFDYLVYNYDLGQNYVILSHNYYKNVNFYDCHNCDLPKQFFFLVWQKWGSMSI